MKQRLVVPLLFMHNTNLSQLDDNGKSYHRALERAIATLYQHLYITTPTDVYLFMRTKYIPGAADWLFKNYTQLAIIPLNEAGIAMPNHLLRDRGMGWTGGWDDDYRMMGDWRLTFMPAFAKELGYQYVLQYDSDSFVPRPAKVHLVQFLRDKKIWLANNHYFFNEHHSYFIGLPELTAFWLKTRGKKPVGCLFNYTRPSDMSGLKSMDGSISANDNPGWTGWQGRMMSGHFVAIDLEWWFDRWIQDYVQLVTRTGAHIEHRWNELSVLSMMWQVFVPEQHFHSFKESEIEGHHGRREFGGWGRH